MDEGTTQVETAPGPSVINNNTEPDATTKALLLPEIITEILTELDFDDILVNCMRVCRTWKLTIETSPKVQQKLDFMPETTELLDGCRPSHFMKLLVEPSLIPKSGRYLEIQTFWFSWDEVEKDPAFAHPNASWRNMVLMQPPLLVSYFIDKNPALKFGSDTKLGEIYDTWKKAKGGPMDAISIRELNEKETKGEKKERNLEYHVYLYSCTSLCRTSEDY